MKRKPEEKNDLAECKRKIYELLDEYDFIIESDSPYAGIYLTNKKKDACVIL